MKLAAKKENLVYLFNWNRVGELNISDIESDGDDLNDDSKSLLRFLKDVISNKVGRDLGLTRQIKIEIESGIKRCYIITRFGKVFRSELEMSNDEKLLMITIFDEDYTSKILSMNLTVKKEYGMYYIFDEKPIRA